MVSIAWSRYAGWDFVKGRIQESDNDKGGFELKLGSKIPAVPLCLKS